MSHLYTRSLAYLTILLLAAAVGCARLGEAPLTLSEQNMLPEQQIQPGMTKPGMGLDGGPITWSFWTKNRQAASDAMLGSFQPFTKVNAVRLSVSAHFVLYRDILATTPPTTIDS